MRILQQRVVVERLALWWCRWCQAAHHLSDSPCIGQRALIRNQRRAKRRRKEERAAEVL